MRKPILLLSAHICSANTRRAFLLVIVLLATTIILAQQKVIQLYSAAAPGSENWTWQENETTKNPLNAHLVYNVTHPTLTAFLPDKSVANGTAVIVCPGGAYQVLFIDWEGNDIARWLAEKGIVAFVLKYRLAHTVTHDPWTEMMGNINSKTFFKDRAPVIQLELEDAKTAMHYIRQHASEYGIDTTRVGIMGFSAGGTVSASLAYNYTPQTRPDFAAPFYAPVDSIQKSSVPKDAPPLFIAAATDDELVPVLNSVHLYSDWMVAKHVTELHLFAKGGHGFAGIKQNLPVDNWKNLLLAWLDAQGMLKWKP